MKSFIAYLLLMLLSSSVPAFAGMTMVMSGGAAGDAYADLLMFITYENGSDEDQTYTIADATEYCVDGDAGAGNDCDTADEGNGNLETAAAIHGSLGFESPAGADDWRFGITADDHWDDEQGTLSLWINVLSYSDGAHIFSITNGCDWIISVENDGGNLEFKAKYDDGPDAMSLQTNYGSFAVSTEYHVVVKYDMTPGAGLDTFQIIVSNNSCTELYDTGVVDNTDNGEDMTPVSITEGESLRTGGQSGTARSVYLDTISTWNTTTRTAAEICALTTSPK